MPRLMTLTSALRFFRLFALVGLAASLISACGVFSPYRYNIPQGNYVTADAVRQVKSGMSREQVRQILGSPLINDPFRQDRWDYVFFFQFADGKTDSRRTSVHFAKDVVAKVEATELPESESADDPVLRRGRTN
jgi:outer membrane protein assembly factor BamE